MRPRIVALVPMRHHSERVPAKNRRLLDGRPLYHHIIETLLACPSLHQVVIDTDSPDILAELPESFPQVHRIERPQHLRGGHVPMNDVLLHDVSQLSADYFLQTHSTNPLLRPGTIENAIRRFLDRSPPQDSLFSVTRLHTRLWTESAQPLNHDPRRLQRTQDLPPIFEENSCLYLFAPATLKASHNRIGAHPLLFEIDRIEAWDIDDEIDFTIAEFLHNNAIQPTGTEQCATES